jgi:hypothetical protein
MLLYIELMSATEWVNFEDYNKFNDYSGSGVLWKNWAICGAVSPEQNSVVNFRKNKGN